MSSNTIVKRAKTLGVFICAAVFLGSILAWIRSDAQSYIFAFRSPRGFLNGVASNHAGFMLASTDLKADGVYGPPDRSGRETVRNCILLTVPAPDLAAMISFSPTERDLKWMGFRLEWGETVWYTAQYNLYAVNIPYWFLILITVLPVATSVRKAWYRWRWRRQGHCISCGYDLRSSSTVCSECGTLIEVRSEL